MILIFVIDIDQQNNNKHSSKVPTKYLQNVNPSWPVTTLKKYRLFVITPTGKNCKSLPVK